MRVLVTGAAGFIGAALAERLLARGDAVLGIDNLNAYYQVSLKQDRLARLRAAGGERFAFLHLDFADYPALTAALADQQFDRIVHLGAQAGVRHSIENPHAYAHSNLVGHLNLLELGTRTRGGSPGLCQFQFGLWRQCQAAFCGGGPRRSPRLALCRDQEGG